MQTIELLDKKWAVGLWWQPLVSSPRKQVNELSEQSPETQENPYNIFAVLKARKQIGVGRAQSVRAETGSPSLAAALTRVFDQYGNVLAYFRFDNGNSWLFAVKDGQILPGGDSYGPDEEVLDQYRRYSQSDIWKQVIETSGTAESEQKVRESLDVLNRTVPRLRPVSRGFWLNGVMSTVRANPKTALVVAGALVLTIAAAVGVQQFLAYKARQDHQAMMQTKRAMLQEKLQQQSKPLEEIRAKLFPAKWRQEPPAFAVVQGCYSRLEQEPYQIKGWTLAEISCEPSRTQIIRKRLKWASFTEIPEGAKFQIKEPNQVIRKIAHDPTARNGREIIDKDSVSANIYELAGILGSPVELAWKKPEAQKIPEEERRKNRNLPEMASSPYWIGQYHLKQIPATHARGAFGLGKIPGLVVNEVRMEKKTWSIKGDVYAK